MKWFTRHPEDRELNRFADGELGERELARINAHLARCPRCREDVGLIRRMGDAAASLSAPIATDEVLRRALARRAAGERVLLPTSDAGALIRRPASRFAPAAIAALLTLMIASLVVSVRVLEADRPALRLYPERPEAGEALTVEYHGTALFADQTHLKLRARYRTAEDRHWQLLAGILVRGDDGLYRTEVQLPDSVVYAAFAVEDLQGERVDSNNRELWDVMVHQDGEPTLDAMTGRLRDLQRRDWGEAYAVSKQMTERYPHAAQSWAIRYSYELSLFDRDSVQTAHRMRFEDLEKRLLEAGYLGEEAKAWLGLYALALGDMEAGGTWIRQSLAADPQNHAAVEGQMVLWGHEAISRPTTVLEKLDTVWSNGTSNPKSVANLGWQVASEVKDWTAARIWMERYLSASPAEVPRMAPRAYQLSGGAALGDWIEREVLSLKTTERLRPLESNQRRHERLEAEQLQAFLATVAWEARKAGETERALRFAEEAVDLAWESNALLNLAEILLEGGRTGSGVNALARAAVDPSTADAAAAQAASLAPATHLAWKERVQQYEPLLQEYVLEGSVLRYIDSDLDLRSAIGRHSLEDLRQGEPTVLAFMSRLCAPALDQLRLLPELARAVEAAGGRLLIVDIDNSNELAAYATAVGVAFPIYVDYAGEVRSAVQSAATPEFFVLDQAGRVRFEHSRIDEVLRQLRSIQASVDVAMAE